MFVIPFLFGLLVGLIITVISFVTLQVTLNKGLAFEQKTESVVISTTPSTMIEKTYGVSINSSHLESSFKIPDNKKTIIRPNLSDIKEKVMKSNCVPSKSIVLDISDFDLGLKLFSIVSSSILAYSMNRGLKLNLTLNSDLDLRFFDKFGISDSSLTDVNPISIVSEHFIDSKIHDVCFVSFDQSNSAFVNMQIFQYTNLFKKLDNECDIIHIHPKVYFGRYLTSNWFAGNYLKNKATFVAPYDDITVQNYKIDIESVEKYNFPTQN